jgi:hypothetical protein
MKVAFVNNQIDNRGTGNALYDYAHYNEEILGNKSVIVSLGMSAPDMGMYDKLIRRFGAVHSGWDLVTRWMGIDVIYHIKSGENDGSLEVPGARYTVHAVFNASQPHGDRYATISEWMGDKFGVPYVPHIVQLPEPIYNIRKENEIPSNAVVFGRHGGADTFDISWAWEAVKEFSEQHDNVYFLFLNTNPPNIEFNERVIFISPTVDDWWKSSFIHACDAMLHARSRGETFGIAVGEFAINGKLVLTYGASPERAHIEQLAGSQTWLYFNKQDLLRGMDAVRDRPGFPWKSGSNYTEFTPHNVMAKFKEVFLD